MDDFNRELLQASVIFVFFVVVRIFLDDVEFDRIETDDFQIASAFATRHDIALIGVRLDMHFGITLWTRSSRHFPLLLLFTVSGNPRARATRKRWSASLHGKVSRLNADNLTA